MSRDLSNDVKNVFIKIFKDYKHCHVEQAIKYDAFLYIKSHISTSYSIITSLFTGLFCSQIKCNECHNINTTFEQFNILSLPLTHDNLNDVLKGFVEPEQLLDINQYNCDECNKKVNGTKKVSIYYSPNILIIQLKRFMNNNNHISKNNRVIKFDINNLDMTEYIYNATGNIKYKLKAVCMHEGSCNAGHYIAYSRNFINNEWYKYNDHIVNHIMEQNIEAEIVNEKAYILFYQRIL